MAGFNVGPSQGFQGKVMRPSYGGRTMPGGGNMGIGQGVMRMGGYPTRGMGGFQNPAPMQNPAPAPMPSPIPYNPAPPMNPNGGVSIAPPSNMNFGGQSPNQPNQGFALKEPNMTPPSYTPPNPNPNPNPQGGLFNRYAMMRGRM